MHAETLLNAFSGLNPHAGENGLFGDQEATVIEPAIALARERGIDCSGPFPADTLFLQACRGKYDMVVAMYHDQGHVPMELLDFEHTVNVSLGLPLIRTSVDHGTGFDIVGQDLADPEDMKSAIGFAVKMVQERQINFRVYSCKSWSNPSVVCNSSYKMIRVQSVAK